MASFVVIERILERARWAPSGDNTQPWRFSILSEDHVVVYGSDTRRSVVYDLCGHASQLAIGILLEYISIAASAEGLTTAITRRPSPEKDENTEHPIFDIFLSKAVSFDPDPLSPFLESRSVNRGLFGMRPLSSKDKKALEEFLPVGYSLFWLEGWVKRVEMAYLNQLSGKLRLSIPEAYSVHKKIIEWNARTSIDRVPDQALGLSPLVLPLMRWIMESWTRVCFFNRFLGGTIIPRLQLDILPALFCSAHCFLLAPSPPNSLDSYVTGGRAVARFWLGCEALGLSVQPEMTPLIFRSYFQKKIKFSIFPNTMELAGVISNKLDKIGDVMTDRAIFLGRIGWDRQPFSRSLRRPLTDLMQEGNFKTIQNLFL